MKSVLDPKRIILVIPTNGIDGRDRMRGVFRYINDHPDWETVLITKRTEVIGGSLAQECAAGCDGMIVSAEPDIYEPVASALSTDIPAVLANEALIALSDARPNCRAVILDDEEIGRTAARHFKSLGLFASYAFYTCYEGFWSQRRCVGFIKELQPMPVSVLSAGDSDEVTWLRSLPKPAAVFAANDLAAKRIATFTRAAGMTIPRDCNVIGCDNDILICQGTTPRLTSIKPNFEQVGWESARALDRLLRGRAVPKVTVVEGCEIVTRESTAGLTPATRLVNRATEYIAANACRGIGVADVAIHLHVSRSLLDLRYREVRKSSVFADILETRLAALRRELAETTTPIGQISRLCGFRDPASLKRLFRNRYGQSMRQFRETARSSLRSFETSSPFVPETQR